jgi:excisionase family DNA binding protein
VPAPTDNELLTCQEVARLYHVHVETIRRWIRKGVITVVRVGPYRLVRIQRSEAQRHFIIERGVDS